MATKKITLNELRSIVKQIIKEERMLNEASSNLLTVLTNIVSKQVSGQKESFSKSPDKLANEIKSLLDTYFPKGNVKSLTNGETYWYKKNGNTFYISGHSNGKGGNNGIRVNIGIVKELQKIDDYLKYQEVYNEVMRAYIVDNNLTTSNKFWAFDKLPNDLNPSEIGIQTSGEQSAPVSEGTKKITMSGLKNMIKEEISKEKY